MGEKRKDYPHIILAIEKINNNIKAINTQIDFIDKTNKETNKEIRKEQKEIVSRQYKIIFSATGFLSLLLIAILGLGKI